MADLRTALAAVLGVGLGLVLVVAPEAAVKVHTVGRGPGGGRGEYGTDSPVSERTRRIVQLVGLAVLASGVYFGAVVAGLA